MNQNESEPFHLHQVKRTNKEVFLKGSTSILELLRSLGQS